MFYELPCMDSRKSFYGKAHVNNDNGEQRLISYDTTVCKIDRNGEFVKLWDGYSSTTMRHINSFRTLNGLPTLSKKEWENMECEPTKPVHSDMTWQESYNAMMFRRAAK